jgi:hypothetical protein
MKPIKRNKRTDRERKIRETVRETQPWFGKGLACWWAEPYFDFESVSDDEFDGWIIIGRQKDGKHFLHGTIYASVEEAIAAGYLSFGTSSRYNAAEAQKALDIARSPI